MKSQTLSFADLYGGKICAALDRQHPRDLFDIRLLLQNEGITEDIKNAFIFYLISHNRSIIELLDPNYKDIQKPFEKELEGMPTIKVSLEELLETRKALIIRLGKILNNDDKKFLISINSGDPVWDSYSFPKIKNFPSIKWKLLNINKVKKSNPAKHKKLFQKLANYFSK